MDLTKNALGFRAAFFFNHLINRPDKVFLGLPSKVAEFDAMPSIQPLPPSIQSDNMPIVRFRSESNIFHCEVSQSRLDFIIRLDERFGSYNYDAIFNEYRNISTNILKYLVEDTTIPLNRIGLVADMFIEQGTPSDAVNLIQSIMKMESDPSAIELTVRTNRRIVVEDTPCNDIRIREVAHFQLNGSPACGVFFSHDLNTALTTNEAIDTSSLQNLMNTLIESHSLHDFASAMGI